MNILEALDDVNLLGASIRDAESWKPWRTLLAAAFGLPLDPYQAELFRQCTGRRVPPGAPAAYLWLVIGRRGGKSFAMALIAVYLAVFKDWRKYLSPGERAIVLLVAADREQAKILHRYAQGILSPPILQSSVLNVTASEIELKGGVTIEVVTRSYRTVRGRSVCVAVLDELSFWRDDDSANPDSEVLNAVRASMATFGSDAMVIAGSSPYARRGVLWDAFKRWHGKDDARNLVWQAATRTMNPTVPQEFVDAEFERDPASANAEYGAEFRSDIAEFVSMDVLDACTADGVFEIPPMSGASYIAFVDPSGGSSDSMTLAIAHREDDDGVAVLDCIREAMAPFSPESVVEDFCDTLKQYQIDKVTGDRYAGEWPAEQFAKRNVTYEPSEKVKSDIYRDTLPLLNSRKCRLLDNRRLISQLHGLERRTARGGKDSIDHGPGAHDDVANAVAGALVLAAGESGIAGLWVKFGEALADAPPVARNDLDPATQAALVWRSRGAGWREYMGRLDAQVIAALEAIERAAWRVPREKEGLFADMIAARLPIALIAERFGTDNTTMREYLRRLEEAKHAPCP